MKTDLLGRARNLRRSMTAEERRLWCLLRPMRRAGFSFRRQHPLGPYIVDFVCFWNNELWDDEVLVLERIEKALRAAADQDLRP